MSKFTLQQIYHFCWLIFFSLLCLAMVIVGANLFSLAIGVVLFFSGTFLYKKAHPVIDLWSNKRVNILASCILILYTTLLFIISQKMVVVPFNDTASVWFSAVEVAETGAVSTVVDEFTGCDWLTYASNNDYLLIYPFTQFMVAFLIPFCKVLHHFGVNLRSYQGYSWAAGLNICLIVASQIFIYLAAKKARGNTCALLTLVTGIFFAPYYLHSYKLYSDTMSMPFGSLAILLTVYADSCDHSRRKYLLRFFSGIAIGLGILLKCSLIILAVAGCIYLLVRRKTFREAVAQTTFMLIGIFLISTSWSVYSRNLSWLDQTEADRYELPTIHVFMMAAQGDGGYSKEDLHFSLSFETLEERKAADTAEFFNRISSHGFIPHAKFTINKIASTLNDGLYYQKAHLWPLSGRGIYRFLNEDSKFFPLLEGYCAAFVWYFYCGFLTSAFLGTKKDNGITFLFNICMFGAIIFFSFYECKSRYFLNLTPMFLLSAAFALDALAKRNHTKIEKTNS